MKHTKYAVAAIVIVILVGATARMSVERSNGTPGEQNRPSEPITLAQADSLERTKLCAMISEEVVPAFYGDVEEWGVARAIAEFERARDEVLVSGDAEKVVATQTMERWAPGIFKHVAAAHSLLDRLDGQAGVDAAKHASDTYMTSCLLLGPENVN